MHKFFPILSWLPHYRKEYLKGDLSAGLTVGVMLIPQGMAYAMIAGLPPIYGLYAAMVPQVIYSIFGTSRQLAVGPVAMDSLLVATGISLMATAGSEQYIALAIMLAFLMGLIQLGFGLFRFGFLVNFLSKPVISGFTFAAALIIGFSQMKHLTGIQLGGNTSIFATIHEVFNRFSEINWMAFSIGIGGIVLIKLVKKIHKSIPGALVVVIAGILFVYLTNLEERGVPIVGDIPAGMPNIVLPIFELETIKELFPIAITLALIAFMEAISVAKALHTQHKKDYEIDANQELIALGLSNIVGSVFSCYPTTGGFGRSAVNNQSGAKTNLAAIISASFVALALLFFTPLFYYLPNAVLASIIMVAVFGLIDVKYPKFLWRNSSQDFAMFAATLLITLFLGIKEGIGAGVTLSLILLIYRSTKPHYAILGRLPNTKDYRNVSRFSHLEVFPEILAFRYDAPLYFANSNHFSDALKSQAGQKGDSLKLIIIHCGSISRIDATGYQVLQELIQDFNEDGIQVFFSGVIGPVRDFFAKVGFTQEVGEEKFFLDVDSAVSYFQSENATYQNSCAIQANLDKRNEK